MGGAESHRLAADFLKQHKSEKLRSRFRRQTYHGADFVLDQAAKSTFDSHVKTTHRLSVKLSQTAVEQMLTHTRRARPDLLPPNEPRVAADRVPKEARLYPIDMVHGQRIGPQGLDTLARSGNSVLYRWSAAGTRTPVPHPKGYKAHFIVDVERKSISYYGGFLTDAGIKALFRKNPDIHDAYWELVDAGERKTGKHIPAVSAEFEPETGRLVHIRERILRNTEPYAEDPFEHGLLATLGGAMRERALYSVDIESSMPLIKDRAEDMTPSIRHKVTIRNRMGPWNRRYPTLDL